MRHPYQTTMGIVLREAPYRDHDKILTVLTRDLGKCTVKARHCRREGNKLTPVARRLVYSELSLYIRGDFMVLNGGVPVMLFQGPGLAYESMALEDYFAQVMEATAQEGEYAPELLSLLLNTLFALEHLHKPRAQVKAVYELRLMCLTGYAPMLRQCAVCGAVEPVHPRLHLQEGLLHCAACRSRLGEGVSLPLSHGALAAARYIEGCSPKKLFSFRLPEGDLRLLAKATEAFLLTQQDRRSYKTLDYYKSLDRTGFSPTGGGGSGPAGPGRDENTKP